MRGAPPAAAMVLGLFAVACGGGTSTARATPATGAATGSATTTSSRSTTMSLSFGSPQAVAATPTARSSSADRAARTAAPVTAPPAPCAPGDVGIATTTDDSRYAVGQTVQVRVVVRDIATHGCVFSAPGDFTIEPDPSGPVVFAVHLACPATGCAPLAPGQMSTYPIGWNQMANQGAGVNQAVPPGAYHARAVFTGYSVATSAPFTVG